MSILSGFSSVAPSDDNAETIWRLECCEWLLAYKLYMTLCCEVCSIVSSVRVGCNCDSDLNCCEDRNCRRSKSNLGLIRLALKGASVASFGVAACLVGLMNLRLFLTDDGVAAALMVGLAKLWKRLGVLGREQGCFTIDLTLTDPSCLFGLVEES